MSADKWSYEKKSDSYRRFDGLHIPGPAFRDDLEAIEVALNVPASKCRDNLFDMYEKCIAYNKKAFIEDHGGWYERQS